MASPQLGDCSVCLEMYIVSTVLMLTKHSKEILKKKTSEGEVQQKFMIEILKFWHFWSTGEDKLK